MTIKDFSDLYLLISSGCQDISTRKQAISLRKRGFNSITKNTFVKVAFDTRRINQETDFNPRRGLQNYHRSEKFITEAMSDKVENFVKLKKVLGQLKAQYGREPEWQDSYSRVLLNTLDKLPLGEKFADYSENQPSMMGFDYIDELLYVRYRLEPNNIKSMSNSELKKIILDRDEELTKTCAIEVDHDEEDIVSDKKKMFTNAYENYVPKREMLNPANEVSRRDIATQGYDTLMDKLFSGARATDKNTEVCRTVTITIKDSLADKVNEEKVFKDSEKDLKKDSAEAVAKETIKHSEKDVKMNQGYIEYLKSKIKV